MKHVLCHDPDPGQVEGVFIGIFLNRVFLHGIVDNEVVEVDEFHLSVEVLDDCGKGFYPIAGIQIPKIADLLVSGCMNVSANYPIAALGLSQFSQFFLKTGYKIYLQQKIKVGKNL